MGVLLSLAALIFSGQLAGFVANGIGLLLVGTCLMNIVLALLSSRPAMVGTVQDAPAVVMALIAANIASSVPTGTASSAIYATVVVAIALTTLITGATFLLLGQFRLGSLVSYLPYPVIGGFLAGIGWLLMLGGVGVMTNIPLVFSELSQLLQPPGLWQWLPGLIFGFVILLALRRSQHILILPGLLVAAIALFYLWERSRIPRSPPHNRAAGCWGRSLLRRCGRPTLGMLATVHWPAIISQGTAIGAAVTTCFLLSRARSLP